MKRGTLTWNLVWFAMAAALGAADARAQQAPQALVVEVADITRADGTIAPVEEAPVLRPGDRISYRLVFTNVTDGPVSNIRFENPLPEGLAYIEDTAVADRPDAEVTYSIDGGETFSPEPIETVVVEGREVQRPAAPDSFTHIRWTVGGSVAPGARVTASFSARLGGDAEPGA